MAAAVRSSPVDTMTQPAGKRKRGNEDIGRNIKDTRHHQPEDDYNSLLQGSVDLDSQRAAQDALNVSYSDVGAFDSGLVEAGFASHSPTQSMNTPQHGLYAPTAPQPAPTAQTDDSPKTGVGSDAWHKARKDSHKEGKSSVPSKTICC